MNRLEEPLRDRRVLITGGTGSLGKVLARRILTGEWGVPRELRIFSRDEGKQHQMRVYFSKLGEQETGLAYRAISGGGDSPLSFQIGDVRDLESVTRALDRIDVVFNAAALKQVPSCEYFPWESVKTNVAGPNNLVHAISQMRDPPEVVVGVSTDKACKPVNVMGMTKALQERVFQHANLLCRETKFVCVRYGNVLASRGSVIPLFHHQIKNGGPVTVTHPQMTRFFLTLDDAVDTIFAALDGYAGETYVPKVPSATIMSLALALVRGKPVDVKVTEIRPGEKLHEELISEEEASRTFTRGSYYAIGSVLPEVAAESPRTEEDGRWDLDLAGAFRSDGPIMNPEELDDLLERNNLMSPAVVEGEELLR